jgi:hypothetical protein
MRILPYFLVILIAISAFSCRKLDELVSFSLKTNDKVFFERVNNSVLTDTIPGNETFSIVSENYLFSDNKKFDINKSSPQTVEFVEILDTNMYFIIGIDSGASNFGFASNMTIYISSPSNQFQEFEIANFPNPASSGNVIDVNMKDEEETWLNIIKKDKYRFRTEFTLINPMPDSIYMNYSMDFRLKAIPND